MRAWIRALVRWLEGGNWHSFDDDHCCAGCEQTAARLRQALAPYRARMSYLNQPVREALPLEPHQRDDAIALLEEGWR